MRCSSQRRDGKRCAANAINGQPFCFLHSAPGKAQELGAKGGARRRVFDLSRLKRFPPAKNATDLVEVTAQTLCDVRSGAIDAKAANSVAGLVAVLVKLFEATSFEERLTRLENFREEFKRGQRTN
jgi:hypothetical protein